MKDFLSISKEGINNFISEIFSKILKIKKALRLEIFFEAAMNDFTILSLIAASIGLLSGLFAVLFHKSIGYLNHIFFLSIKFVYIIPLLGMILQYFLQKLYSTKNIYKGLTEVVNSIQRNELKLPAGSMLYNFISSSLSLSTGIPLGPEGPSAVIGSGIGSFVSNFFNLPKNFTKIFIAAGAGAAISAIFNTPIAGVFFATEIILLNNFNIPSVSAIIIASVAASTITRYLIGDYTVFKFIPSDHEKSIILFFIYILIGILTGLTSLLFTVFNLRTKEFFENLYKNSKNYKLLMMLFVGTIISLVGFFFPEVLGIGYNSINKLYVTKISLISTIIIFSLKFMLVPISFHSGAAGGYFAPSLFLGAYLGYIFYSILNLLGINIDLGTITYVCMGAMLGGIFSIPFTALLMVFELSRSYSIILPLMLTIIFSNLTTFYLTKKIKSLKNFELFNYAARKNDIFLEYLKSIKISEEKIEPVIVIYETETLTNIVKLFINEEFQAIYVINSNGKLLGQIKENQIRNVFNNYKELNNIFVAKDLMVPIENYVKLDSNLLDAFEKMITNNFNEILVLDNSEKPVGIIKLKKIRNHFELIQKEIF